MILLIGNATFDCSVNRSNCIDGTCQCDPGYIFDGSFTACITVHMVTITKNRCSALRIYQEVEYAEMEFCAEGYYFIHGKCRAYSGLLEKCQENGDFQTSRCINNICNCSPGYYQRKYRTCRPDAKVHDKRCIHK